MDTQKKRGRPEKEGRLVQIRIPAALELEIDRYRGAQSPIPSRTAAIIALVQHGLSGEQIEVPPNQ